MYARLSIVFILIITMATTVPSHPLNGRAAQPASRQETKLTPEEEQQARAVGKRFTERWRATNDFGQIMDELFVKDFSERLWQSPQDELPWIFVDKSLAIHASPKELRRYYVAAMNFYGLYSGLYEAVEALREQSENKEGSVKLTEVLSPEVIKVLLSNKTFAQLTELNKEEESDEYAKEDDNGQPEKSGNSAQAASASTEADTDESTEQSEIGIIKSLPQLKEAVATLEEANELMRRRLVKMSRAVNTASENGEAESKQGSANPRLTSLDEEEYGYPKDTPVIHLESFPFCLQLIKLEGQFMILSASICVD
jgi:hypothetical protein